MKFYCFRYSSGKLFEFFNFPLVPLRKCFYVVLVKYFLTFFFGKLRYQSVSLAKNISIVIKYQYGHILRSFSRINLQKHLMGFPKCPCQYLLKYTYFQSTYTFGENNNNTTDDNNTNIITFLNLF